MHITIILDEFGYMGRIAELVEWCTEYFRVKNLDSWLQQHGGWVCLKNHYSYINSNINLIIACSLTYVYIGNNLKICSNGLCMLRVVLPIERCVLFTNISTTSINYLLFENFC